MWLCFFDCFETLSWEVYTNRDTNSRWTRLLSSPFSTERNVLLAKPETSPPFLLVNPILPTPHPNPPKEENVVQMRERSSIFANRGDCFVCTTWVLKSFRLFRNQNPELVTCRITYKWYVFDFEIELQKKRKTILIFKWMSSIPVGKAYLHCSKSKNDS